MATNTTAGGRPKNIFGRTPADFAVYWGKTVKYATPAEVLEPGFGATGHLVNKLKTHLLRLQLIPTDGSNKFFWVKVDSPYGDVSFALPAAMSAADLPELLAAWELDNLQWVEGHVGSVIFPQSWSMPGVYNVSPKTFHILAFDEATKAFTLAVRKGIHASKSTMAGILCGENVWTIMEHLRSVDREVPFPLNGPKLHTRLVQELREVGAAYFRAKLLKPYDGFLHPHIPHASIINLPSTAIPGFNP